jgi:hypothetical protein
LGTGHPRCAFNRLLGRAPTRSRQITTPMSSQHRHGVSANSLPLALSSAESRDGLWPMRSCETRRRNTKPARVAGLFFFLPPKLSAIVRVGDWRYADSTERAKRSKRRRGRLRAQLRSGSMQHDSANHHRATLNREVRIRHRREHCLSLMILHILLRPPRERDLSVA